MVNAKTYDQIVPSEGVANDQWEGYRRKSIESRSTMHGGIKPRPAPVNTSITDPESPTFAHLGLNIGVHDDMPVSPSGLFGLPTSPIGLGSPRTQFPLSPTPSSALGKSSSQNPFDFDMGISPGSLSLPGRAKFSEDALHWKGFSNESSDFSHLENPFPILRSRIQSFEGPLGSPTDLSSMSMSLESAERRIRRLSKTDSPADENQPATANPNTFFHGLLMGAGAHHPDVNAILDSSHSLKRKADFPSTPTEYEALQHASKRARYSDPAAPSSRRPSYGFQQGGLSLSTIEQLSGASQAQSAFFQRQRYQQDRPGLMLHSPRFGSFGSPLMASSQSMQQHGIGRISPTGFSTTGGFPTARPRTQPGQSFQSPVPQGSSAAESTDSSAQSTSKRRTALDEILAAGATKSAGLRWSAEQDAQLKDAVEKYKGANWKAIADMVEGRNHVQCLQRWKKVLQPGLIKGMWSDAEDKLLLELMESLGKEKSWTKIAEHIPGRTAKQCRERWYLNLDPSINREPWTKEEDKTLLDMHKKLGNKWAEIKRQLPGRTENGVKSRFKSIQRALRKGPR